MEILSSVTFVDLSERHVQILCAQVSGGNVHSEPYCVSVIRSNLIPGQIIINKLLIDINNLKINNNLMFIVETPASRKCHDFPRWNHSILP